MTTTTHRYSTREGWLQAAIDAFRSVAEEVAGHDVPERLYVSVGFPTGTRKGANRAIGQCHYTTKDGNSTLFVSPELGDPVRILDVLLHEVIHASLPVGTGHRGAFVAAMKAWGLGGKPTATIAERGSLLHDALTALARELGEYPHSTLTAAAAAGRKQSTRMKKMECASCGYIARTTRRWLDAYGPTLCPCGYGPMELEL